MSMKSLHYHPACLVSQSTKEMISSTGTRFNDTRSMVFNNMLISHVDCIFYIYYSSSSVSSPDEESNRMVSTSCFVCSAAGEKRQKKGSHFVMSEEVAH